MYLPVCLSRSVTINSTISSGHNDNKIKSTICSSNHNEHNTGKVNGNNRRDWRERGVGRSGDVSLSGDMWSCTLRQVLLCALSQERPVIFPLGSCLWSLRSECGIWGLKEVYLCHDLPCHAVSRDSRANQMFLCFWHWAYTWSRTVSALYHWENLWEVFWIMYLNVWKMHIQFVLSD